MPPFHIDIDIIIFIMLRFNTRTSENHFFQISDVRVRTKEASEYPISLTKTSENCFFQISDDLVGAKEASEYPIFQTKTSGNYFF